jgi:hypothetical protein
MGFLTQIISSNRFCYSSLFAECANAIDSGVCTKSHPTISILVICSLKVNNYEQQSQ